MKEVKVNTGRDRIAIALFGDIDSGNADEFLDEVMRAYRAAPADIVFDCRALEFIDSTTLGTFVKIKKRLAEGGHTVKLTALQPKIKKLFLICNLDAIMEIES